MKTVLTSKTIYLCGALAWALSTQAYAALITNGGFESGFSGWTRADQVGSDGTFSLQTGTLSPITGTTVPAPPQGTTAAMTDSLGPGSHVLYQDFIVPVVVPGGAIRFSLFINNGATTFSIPNHLDFSTPALNQQARVDIITTSADPFSVVAADVLQKLYQTQPGNPLVSGYNSIVVDISTLLLARQGQTLRLRFAEVDNVAPFNLGVDAVDITLGNPIPEPATWTLMFAALAGLGFFRRRSSRMFASYRTLDVRLRNDAVLQAVHQVSPATLDWETNSSHEIGETGV
ncbi:MAG: hypothetical protein JWQ01_4593 [Massilia sp.]|nr:hypothetical protein [Massilia sp.]